MGLLKETMQAIIRIDRNLAEIRTAFVKDSSDYRAEYPKKSIKQICSDIQQTIDKEVSLFNRLPQLKVFPYPDHLTFGGRLKALRMFNDLTQSEIGDSIGVTCGHISNLEKDITQPSGMLIRAVSRTFNIDETWLATGHLPQTVKEPFQHINANKVVPLSGYGGGNSGYANLPREILIDRGDDRGLLAVHRPPLVDQNVGQENI